MVLRPGIVTLLAVLQFIGGGIWLLVGGVVIFGTLTDNSTTQEPFAMGIGILLLGLSGYQIICGLGLWRLQNYGRVMQIISAALGLFAIPLGTLISIAVLIYVSKPGIKLLFSGRPSEEMSAEELALIGNAASSGSSRVIMIVGAAVLLIVVVGIVAAIAVPGLLRARMSGNESAAIGSLRAINSAEASYSAAAGGGGYAITLSTLAAACPGTSQGFISPDLSQDPTIRSGYTVELETADRGKGPRDCNGQLTEVDYVATAVPVTVGTTGNRAFATSGAGTIFFDQSGVPPRRAAILDATATPIQ